jgi:beta-galactosidase beta subunit
MNDKHHLQSLKTTADNLKTTADNLEKTADELHQSAIDLKICIKGEKKNETNRKTL